MPRVTLVPLCRRCGEPLDADGGRIALCPMCGAHFAGGAGIEVMRREPVPAEPWAVELLLHAVLGSGFVMLFVSSLMLISRTLGTQ